MTGWILTLNILEELQLSCIHKLHKEFSIKFMKTNTLLRRLSINNIVNNVNDF